MIQSARRYWPVVALSVIVLMGLAAVYSFRRHPTYTATAQLSSIDLTVGNLAALPGVVTASQTLAAIYSRAIDADAVSVPVARQLNVTPGFVVAHTSATPVPQSPIIKIQGTAANTALAVKLANAAMQHLNAYVKTFSGAGASTRGILIRFREAQLRMSRLQAVAARARKTYNANPTDANRNALDNASADIGQAQLRVNAISAAYQAVKQSQSSAPATQVLAIARGASSDRKTKAQAALFIGLVAGLAIGLALATLLANRRRRRAI